MWFFSYQLLLGCLLVLALPVALLMRRRHYAASLRSRLGHGWPSPEGRRPLWIHAVSVGEVGVAATLAADLPATLPLLVTTVTPTGQERARHHFPHAVVTYLPFDLAFLVRRFLALYRPSALILCEGDLWPAVMRAAADDGIPIAVVNGRLSDRSFRRMRRIRRLLGPLLDPVHWFAVQTDTDRQRLEALGVPADRISITGNLKFESPEPVLDAVLERRFRELAAERPVLVAGSTMAGEEELVLGAFEAIGGGSAALLLLAPRHPERWHTVAELLERGKWSWCRRSSLPSPPGSRPAVVLLDTLGELAGVYRLARATFIGGTLVPTGGHNPLEPARFGVPVAVGPSMENFHEVAAVFDAAAAWQRVRDGADLASCWRRWLDEPASARAIGRRGQSVVDRHRGALAATIAGLETLLSSPSSEA